MAEKRLGIKATWDPGEALGGLQDVSDALKNVGKGAIEAAGGKDAWAAFGAEVKKVAPDLGDIAKGAFDAGSALDKLGRTGDNIGALESGMVKAQVKVTALKDAITELEARGIAVGPEIKDSVAKMEGGIDTAKAKTEALKAAFADAASKIQGDAKGAAGALGALGAEGKAVADALKALEKAEGPRAVGIAAAKLNLALEDLAATGKVTGKTLETAFTQASAASEKAVAGSRRLADAMGDAKTKGDIAAKGFEAVGGAAGSLNGMLSQLKDTGGKASQGLADAGFAALALAAAWELGTAAGEKLDKSLMDAGVRTDKFREYVADAVIQSLKLRGDLKDSIPTTELFSGKMQAAGMAMLDLSKRTGEAKVDLEKFGIVLKGVGTDSNNFKKMGDDFEVTLKKMEKLKEVPEFIKENVASILQWRDMNLAAGKSIDDLSPKQQKMIHDAEAENDVRQKGIKTYTEEQAAIYAGVDAIVKERQEREAGSKVRQDDIKRLDELATAVSKGQRSEEDLRLELERVHNQTGLSVAGIEKLIAAHEKSREGIEKEIEGLAKLADATDMGRASVKTYEDGLAALAKTRGISVQEIRAEVEAKKLEIQINKDSVPVYKNVEEAMSKVTAETTRLENALRGEINAINDAALAESARINAGQGKTPAQYQDDYNKALEETAKLKETGDGAADMNAAIIARKKETEAYMLLQAAQGQAEEDLKGKIEGTTKAIGDAAAATRTYTVDVKALNQELLALDKKSQDIIDKLGIMASQYGITDASVRQLTDAMEKKLKALGSEHDVISDGARRQAMDDYISQIQALIRAWEMARVDMPASGTEITKLNTQIAAAVKLIDELKKSMGV